MDRTICTYTYVCSTIKGEPARSWSLRTGSDRHLGVSKERLVTQFTTPIAIVKNEPKVQLERQRSGVSAYLRLEVMPT
jgi:hypothetical protein